MRRKNPVFIGEILREIRRDDSSLSNGMKEVSILGAWQEAAGRDIAESTTKLFIRNRKLYVHFSSAAARNELFLRRHEVLRKLNEAAGERYLTFISIF